MGIVYAPALRGPICEQSVWKTQKKKKNKKTLSKTNILDMIFLLRFDSVFENLKK